MLPNKKNKFDFSQKQETSIKKAGVIWNTVPWHFMVGWPCKRKNGIDWCVKVEISRFIIHEDLFHSGPIKAGVEAFSPINLLNISGSQSGREWQAED